MPSLESESLSTIALTSQLLEVTLNCLISLLAYEQLERNYTHPDEKLR